MAKALIIRHPTLYKALCQLLYFRKLTWYVLANFIS